MSSNKALLTQLIDAVIENDAKKVTELLKKGVDPNECLDNAHITPLHYAAQNDSLEVIPILIEAGAIIDAATEPDGLTPIEIAMVHDNHKIIQLLSAYSVGDNKQH